MADAHSKLTQLLSQMNAPPAPSVAPATGTTKTVLPTALTPSALSAAAAQKTKQQVAAAAAEKKWQSVDGGLAAENLRLRRELEQVKARMEGMESMSHGGARAVGVPATATAAVAVS